MPQGCVGMLVALICLSAGLRHWFLPVSTPLMLAGDTKCPVIKTPGQLSGWRLAMMLMLVSQLGHLRLRYLWNLLVGLSGMVRSMSPASSAGLR